MKPREAIKGARLILVTDPRPDLVSRVEAAVRGGVDVVQLREKRAARDEILSLAEELREICARGGALFTVNDDIELARLRKAAGVHLGQEDEPVSKAREALGPDAVAGRSAAAWRRRARPSARAPTTSASGPSSPPRRSPTRT